MTYPVQSDAYTGPLDLLVSLAHCGQVDLRGLSLREIAEGYLRRAAEGVDLDEGTEVLVQLAVLADLKVRTLVPHAPPAEELPPEDETASDVG